MATRQIAIAIACVATLCIARPAPGCGGWDEEEPATLDQTLPTLPAKSLGQILMETSPAVKKPQADYAAEIEKISARIGKDSPADLTKAVDDLLAKARMDYADDMWCNLLEDTRDVVSASSENPAAALGYLRWRLQHMDWFKPPKVEPGGWPPQNPKVTPEQIAEVELLTKTAQGPLKAHWLYLRGAMLFKLGDRSECRQWFEEVVKEFPDHPRAEVARFLLARCDLSASRDMPYPDSPDKQKEAEAARQKAVSSFEEFRKKYPGGRFDADALGWLGALAFDHGDDLSALKYYIAQAEDPTHPEVHKSAVFMCEKVLAGDSDRGTDGVQGVAGDDEDIYALIARHPAVAMAYIYQVLNVSWQQGDSTEPADVKKWKRQVLPRIAAEVAKQRDLYKSDDWQPRYLAMMALASSDGGDQEQALQITNVAAEEISRSDDLLYARGLALQRSGRLRDAIDVYREMLKRFPDGALTNGVRLRIALALIDVHEAGAAIIELRSLRKALDPADTLDHSEYVYPASYKDLQYSDGGIAENIEGVDQEQIDDVIDATLNFAPLAELGKMLDGGDLDDAAKSELRAIMAERYLIAEDFEGAKKYMTDAQYGLVAAGLEKLTRETAAAPAGRQRAGKYAALGDAWAQIRGKLLRQPLANDRSMTAILEANAPFYGMPDFLSRRANGRALGFAGVEENLDDRDELHHASRWWMRAAREDPGTALSAAARWKALEAMPAIASQSLYTEQRAREIGIRQVSREIYDKLRAERPDSVEAKRYAVYWSIPDIGKDAQTIAERWEGARYHIWTDYQDIYARGYTYFDYKAFTPEEQQDWGNYAGQDSGPDYKVWEDVAKRIGNLLNLSAGDDKEPVRKELDDLAEKARKNDTPDEATVLNFLDDMVLFAQEKNVTPKMLRAYLALRLDILCLTKSSDSDLWKNVAPEKDAATIGLAISDMSADPEMKSVEDYLDCARIAWLGTQKGDGFARDYQEMEEKCRDFLATYPHSRKREAVMFVLARSVNELTNWTVKNEAPERIPDTDKDMGVAPATDTAAPGDQTNQDNPSPPKRPQYPPKILLKVLDAYDSEFPKGRYEADIRDYRASIAWHARDWGNALDLTMAEIDDRSKPYLRDEAALRLANIFSGLASKDYRADLLDVIGKRAEARSLLKMYLATAPMHSDHPLRYLQAYLNDQLSLDEK